MWHGCEPCPNWSVWLGHSSSCWQAFHWSEFPWACKASVWRVCIAMAWGRTFLRVLPLLLRSMMRLGRFRARLTCLWLLLLDPRLQMPDLMTVWPDVSCDTTVMTSRLSLFTEMLLDMLCNLGVSILTQNKSSYLLEINVSYGAGHIYQKKYSQFCPF
jgi:hypothetical protein